MRSKIGLSVVCVAFFLFAPCNAKSEQAGTLLIPGSQNPTLGEDQTRTIPGQRPDAEDEQHSRIEKDMAKRANKERQVQLKRDTDRLVKLANELQDYVDKSNEGILSLDVVKKAEEIEKLAHSVKEKMKGQ